MKRFILLSACALMTLVAQFVMNCSTPLEKTIGPNPLPPVILTDTVINYDTVITTDTIFGTDTIIVVDTIIDIDTVIITDTIPSTDTLIIYDTVIQIDTVIDTIFDGDTIIVVDTIFDTIPGDTLFIIDTVIVIVPDTTGLVGFCDLLSSKHHKFDMMLMVGSGDYRFELEGTAESKPCQTLIVEIDGQYHMWDPYASPDLTIDQTIGANIYFRIYPEHPNCFGHEIGICVRITKM